MPPIKNRHTNRSFLLSRLAGLSELQQRRILLAVLTIGLLFFSLWAQVLPTKVDWSVGDTAERTITAPRSAVYIATEQTERLREEAADRVPYEYRPIADAKDKVLRVISDIFAQARDIRQNSAPDLPTIDKMTQLQERLAIGLSNATLRTAVEKPLTTLEQVEAAAQDLAATEMGKPLRENTNDIAQAQERIAERAKRLNLTAAAAAAAAEIARLSLKPNQSFDHEATEGKRRLAREAVQPIERTVQAREVIIAEGDTVTTLHLDMLRAVGLINPLIDYTQGLAMLALLTLIVILLWAFAARLAPGVYDDVGRLALLSVVIITAALIFRISHQSAHFEAIVLTAATAACMLLALATRPLLASGTAAILGLLVGVVTPSSDVRLVVATIICGLFAANVSAIRGSWSRTVAQAAVMVALANPVILLATTEAFSSVVQWNVVGATALGGVAATLLAIGAIIVLERPLGLLTDLRLMELSNPNEPILRQLRREAPATYQSATMVASLAEQAAEAIGANGLLAHTAALYHDIGKIRRPYFFVENQFGGENPHEKLTPHLSAMVISAHVKDGLEIAQEIGLPPAIASAIPQSHGTYLIQYFYQKAREQAGEDEEVSEESFRYPGPKPQTKENALVMLADIVEAAARTLDEPTPSNVERLVNKLVDEKVAEGQLDECPLTFADVKRLRRSLIDGINTMFHQRIKYPDQIERDAEEVAKAYGQPEEVRD